MNSRTPQAQNPPPRRVRLSPHARKALRRTLLVVLTMLVLSLVLSRGWLGPFSVIIKSPQGTALDQLTRFVYPWPAPRPARGFPLVILVDLDQASVQQLSPEGYVFNRGQMARLLQKLMEYRPKAVFLDFDLSQPSNEGGVRSAGDQQLLQTLRQVSSLLLLPDPQVMGLPLAQVSPRLEQVAAQILYDGDGQARWVPRPRSGQPLAASLALYCLGAGLDQARCRNLGQGSQDGKRIVFRQVRRYGPDTEGTQLWPGLVVISGNELLADTLAKSPQTEGALFLVGRTYPVSDDAHFTPVGALQGIDIHLSALMTLATYRHFSEVLGWGPLLLVVAVLVFVALWLTYTITDGLLRASRFRDFTQALIETAIAAWFLFFAGVLVLQYYGHFLDYLFPILAFQLGMLALKPFSGGKKHETGHVEHQAPEAKP
ncbi:MAG: CHASE2 domain-containing protein [Thermaceae bacterium]|nr:CHASE2 domain-containing protein [Thermaceae bacterium]